MKNALIIFVRNPEKGKVKTRLAASLGEEAALCIYQKLLQHTLHVTQKANANKVVFYAGQIAADDMWQREGYVKRPQADGDLGHRMKDAFETVFRMGYDRVCIVGSDCYELTPAIIADAFAALEKKDLVIGPANDGGYYLLGMKQVWPALFAQKSWSQPTVFDDTLKDVERLKLSLERLPSLNDVDEAQDVPKEWLTQLNN